MTRMPSRTPLALWLGGTALTLALGACAMQPPAPAPAAASLAGTEWRLEAVGDRPALPQPQATLAFPEPGRVAGSTSCNRFFGSVAIEGTSIRFGQLGSTRMACIGPAGEQERRVLQALTAAQRYELRGDTLVIHSRDTGALRYTRTQ